MNKRNPAYKNVSDVMSFNYKQCILETNRNHDNSLAIALSGRWQKKSAIHFTSSLTSKAIYVMKPSSRVLHCINYAI